jgi:hypothetical protein
MVQVTATCKLHLTGRYEYFLHMKIILKMTMTFSKTLNRVHAHSTE